MQAGDGAVTITFQVAQAMAFTGPGTGLVGGTDTLSATGGASGNPVVFSLDPTSGTGVCTLSGTNGATVSYTSVGSCVIDADQAGNAAYGPAPQVQQAVTVAKRAQVITFTVPGSGQVGSSATLSATGGASGNPVVFSLDATSGRGVCTLSGTTVRYNAVGSCVIDANQAGNASYSPAPPVQQTVAVRRSQTITFAAPPNRTLAQSPVTVTVTATASSGLAVGFTTTTPSVCAAGGANGATITLLGPGTCTVQASQPGNATYNPAPAVSRSFSVTA